LSTKSFILCIQNISQKTYRFRTITYYTYEMFGAFNAKECFQTYKEKNKPHRSKSNSLVALLRILKNSMYKIRVTLHGFIILKKNLFYVTQLFKLWKQYDCLFPSLASADYILLYKQWFIVVLCMFVCNNNIVYKLNEMVSWYSYDGKCMHSYRMLPSSQLINKFRVISNYFLFGWYKIKLKTILCLNL